MIVAFNAASVLFPSGNARLSTIAAFAAFVALAIMVRSWRPVVACLAWLFGFEALFNLTGILLGRPAVLDPIHFGIYLFLGLCGPLWLVRGGWRPRYGLLMGAAACWMIWTVTGFHVNQHTMVDFSPVAEVLNEVSKTLWAAAYLLPLLSAGGSLRLPRRSRQPRQSQANSAGSS